MLLGRAEGLSEPPSLRHQQCFTKVGHLGLALNVEHHLQRGREGTGTPGRARGYLRRGQCGGAGEAEVSSVWLDSQERTPVSQPSFYMPHKDTDSAQPQGAKEPPRVLIQGLFVFELTKFILITKVI